MSGLRGPDSSKDAQLLDNAVFPETVDINIRQLDPIPGPPYFLKEIPLTDEMSDLVLNVPSGNPRCAQRQRRSSACHRRPMLDS